jgi:FkbM family methyltransferase
MESDGACRSAPLEILNFGHYEPQEMEMLGHLVKNGDVILDIGAHIGFTSLFLSKAFPQSQIYAFEPIPDTYAFLLKNIQYNVCENIHTFNYGLSNKAQDVLFHYFRGGSALASQMNLIGHKSVRIKCHLERLDDVVLSIGIQRVDVIKCDIEGGELGAIEGGLHVIKDFLPILFVELYEEWCQKFNYSADDVLRLLGGLGYQCFSISKGRLKRETSIKNEGGNYNYFFLHQDKHQSLIKKHL